MPYYILITHDNILGAYFTPPHFLAPLNMFNSNFDPLYALVNIQIDIVVKLYFSENTVCTLSLSRSVLSHNTTPRYNTADLGGF